MLKRRTQARFMSGAYVFPGGVVEESDLDIKWKYLTPLSPHPFHEIVLENEPKQKIDEFHFRIGSLRELFEVINFGYFKNNNFLILKGRKFITRSRAHKPRCFTELENFSSSIFLQVLNQI